MSKNSKAFERLSDYIGNDDGWTKRIPRRVLLKLVRDIERVSRDAECKACAALALEYGDVSVSEAILRRNNGPLWRDEEGPC